MADFESNAAASARNVIGQHRDFRFWTEEKLRNADTDQFRHVNNAAIATLFEAARMEIFAPRPIHTAMDTSGLTALTGLRPRPWRDALRDYLETYYRH